MTGRLADLNDKLFATMDRLSAQDLKGKALEEEVARARAMVDVADQITANNRTAIAAAALFATHGEKVLPYLPKVGAISQPNQIEGRAEK